MEKITYIEARDKIWNAYFRDEIKPYRKTFCFCGTLAGGSTWSQGNERLDYSLIEFGKMERALLTPMGCSVFQPGLAMGGIVEGDPNYEERIFEGMLAALEVLKQIHRERGEVIPEDEPLLAKRNLVLIP